MSNQSWYIHMGGGRIYLGMKYGSYVVWPVAGFLAERPALPDRFNIMHRIVHDRFTGLLWLKPRGNMKQPVTWKNSFSIINGLNAQSAEGHADWRLSNIRQIESLVDFNLHSPALAADQFFEPVAEVYWSSTTSVYEPSYAWVLYPKDGAIGVGYKPNSDFYVWAFRSDKHCRK